jgi:peptidoglycan/LPS O-acetylase OafA/YrhL
VSREFRADVQALRGIAVLLVVIYHANLGLFPAGYLGVDVFFVISGFLITGLIKVQLEQGRFSFWEFYYRRAKRLLPAAYVVIALTTLAAPFFLSDLGLREFGYQVLGALTFTGNIALWLQSDYFAGAAETKPLLHVWSLAVEEQYYLLLPAFLALTPRRLWFSGIILLLVGSLTFCLYLVNRNPSAAFYLLPTRFWEMAIGSVGALLSASYPLRSGLSWLRLPALAILLIIPIMPVGGPHPGIDAVLICVGTLVLLLAPTKDNIAVRCLSKVGDLSYSLYLIHWPVLVYVRAAWLTEPPAEAIYAALVFSFVASWVLYRFIEEPFRRGFLTTQKRLLSGLAAASVVLGLSPSVLIAATTSDIDFTRVRRHNHGLGSACVFKPGSPPKDIPQRCQTTDKPRLLIWGDSYAMAIAPGLAETAGETGLAQLTMSACGPAIGAARFEKGSTSRYGRAFAENCIRFNDSVLDILRRKSEVEVVAISSPFSTALGPNRLVRNGTGFEETQNSMDQAAADIRALVDAVRAAGKKVVIVAPPPSIGIDFGECVERKLQGRVILGNYSDCQMPLSAALSVRAPILEFLRQVSQKANVEVISLYDVLCDEMMCKTEMGGKLLYRDQGHLSYDGSKIVARRAALAEKIIKAAR